jgi:hypothetical protein
VSGLQVAGSLPALRVRVVVWCAGVSRPRDSSWSAAVSEFRMPRRQLAGRTGSVVPSHPRLSDPGFRGSCVAIAANPPAQCRFAFCVPGARFQLYPQMINLCYMDPPYMSVRQANAPVGTGYRRPERSRLPAMAVPPS